MFFKKSGLEVDCAWCSRRLKITDIDFNQTYNKHVIMIESCKECAERQLREAGENWRDKE